MRIISRTVLATAFAVLAMSAITAIPASAAEWHVGGKPLTGSTALTKAAKMEENLTMTFFEGNDVITCSGVSLEAEGKSTPEILAPSALKTEWLVFNGCKMTKPTTCKVEFERIYIEPFEATMTAGTYPEDKLALSPKGGNFFYFTLDGSCALAGEIELDSKWTLLAPKGQEELTEQTFVGQGSKEKPAGFTWGNQPIYLTGKFKLKLASGSPWSFH
jgi:hypothetical protein